MRVPITEWSAYNEYIEYQIIGNIFPVKQINYQYLGHIIRNCKFNCCYSYTDEMIQGKTSVRTRMISWLCNLL